MTFDVVTTYAQRHWDQYAKRCVDTFHEHWDCHVSMKALEDSALMASSSWLREFKARNEHRPTANYRFDAVRFAHKIAAIEIAYRESVRDVLIWMDADCVTHSPVTVQWLEGLLGQAEFAYLVRTTKYPETGFMIFRRCPMVSQFLREVVELYKTDRIFALDEWHDCWAIQETLLHVPVKCVSLSGDAAHTGHPLVNGPLGEKLDHLKGKRKQAGKSFRSDLKTTRQEVYWNA